MGVCPFHGDKDPSLSITPDKGLWYCFGCHEGGNTISFIKKKENLDFADAVRFLAQLYNIPVPEIASDPDAVKRRTLFDVNDRARDLFVKILRSKAGRPFREYLSTRGFKGETAIAFRVGASVQSWDFLSKRLLGEGFAEEELIKAGLSVQSKIGGIVDRFRGRLMIPIIDTLDRTLGFGARAMGADSPKYINSPESPIFQKSKILFGLYLAKEACRKTGTLVVMEGYTDVMLAHQAGVKNCCAVMGTALTKDHIPILNRFADHVVLAFDGDEAGRKAALRSILELGDVQFTLKVLPLPEGADPADIVTGEGAERFAERLSNAVQATDWMFETVAAPVRESDLKAKLRAFREIAPFILLHRSPAIQDQLLEQAGLAFRTNASVLLTALRQSQSSSKRSIEALESVIASSGGVEKVFFLSIMANPEFLHEARNLLEPVDFDDPVHRKLARLLFQEGFSLGSPDGLMRLPEIYEDDLLRSCVVGLTQELIGDEDSVPVPCSQDEYRWSIVKLLERQWNRESKRYERELSQICAPGVPLDDDIRLKREQLLKDMQELDLNMQEICRRLGHDDLGDSRTPDQSVP